MAKSFVADFSPVIYKLNENYRSAKRIVGFAYCLEHYDSVMVIVLNCQQNVTWRF